MTVLIALNRPTSNSNSQPPSFIIHNWNNKFLRMTRKKKAASGPRGKPKSVRNPATTRFPLESPHFSLQEEARTTQRFRTDWTPELKLRYTKVNFVAGGLHNPTDEDNEIQESNISNCGAEADMERLNRLSGNATAFVPMPSSQPTFQQQVLVVDQDLFVVDTQGQKPMIKQRRAPVVRSPSPTSSGSSDEEVVFAGRRPQTSQGKAVASKSM